ncbi:MAG: glycosyltransferase [Verrucomicrobiia bacterium]|jgi:glycosyltransferase involved in cell wall biosynthesis/tetratricopeptide (TPR) repeat protein
MKREMEAMADLPGTPGSRSIRHDGKFSYLSDEALAVELGGTDEREQLKQVADRIAGVLASLDLGPFYFHCGGAGDALLLLATFYDAHPNSVVVSYPNSQAAMRSFFEAFPALKQVCFLPQHSRVQINKLLRQVVPQLPNFRGKGVTPGKDYGEEWGEQLDVFRDYGVVKRPQWARLHAEACRSKRVAVAPQGSLVGMAGTKRNLIEPRDWLPLLDFLKQQGWHPMIVGTPNERETYPCPEGCDDQRSYSFRDQMDQIARCALFVGADSWAKSFAALTGMPTYVFDAIKCGDWKGLKDPSDFVFLDPWDSLQVVSGLEALKDCLTRQPRRIHTPASPGGGSSQTVHVAWEGTFADNGSLSHVNRELTRALSQQPKLEITRVGKGHRDQAPTRTGVTVRHAWPPNWQRPKSGYWVLIQPWEYGSLPLDWVSRLSGVAEIWVPSEYVRRVYVDSGVAPGKVHVVPNGIDPERFRPGVTPLPLATSKTFKFLFVGGTIHRKGPDLLLKAFTENFTAADDVCLVIKDFGGESVYAGQTLQEQIQAAQARPGAPEIVYLTDELAADAMPGLYAACDCLVHPYRGEGFALPVLEAMACGLPVIVTAGGATDDFATEDRAYPISASRQRIGYRVGPFRLARPGWLLEPSFDELKQRMGWVFEHRDEARTKGQRASEVARRDWTWDRAARVAAQRLRALAAVPHTPSGRKPVAIELPAAGRLGDLAEAREFFRQKRYREAWNAALHAMDVRPFHPDARALLKKIKKTAGAIVPAVPVDNGVPRLSVCLIVKNEESFLARCLGSVRDVASQIVVVDTGSADRTKEIAQQHGAELYDFPWNDDFSAARNAALEHVRGDWVLVLDADEELSADGRETLQREMRADKVLAYRLPIVDVGREEDGCNYVPRLFRNAPGLFFVGRIHEQVFSSVEVRRKQWGMENKFSTATLIHHGYTAEVVADRNKLSRNLRLLEQAIEERPNEPNLLMNYGLELARAGRKDMAVDRYLEALRALQAMPEDRVAPEMREALLTQLCTQLIAARQYEPVIRLLQSPVAQRGGLTASQHFGWGLACSQLGQFEEAIEQFRQCLAKRDRPSLTPVNRDIRKAAPHHCLAICLHRLGRLDEAAAAFQQALAADPHSRRVRFDFATLLESRRQPVDALQILHGLIAEKADDLPVWLFGAHIALKQPRFLEFACQWTGEGIKLFPQDKLLTLQRAEALMLSHHVSEALPLWRRAGTPANPAHRAAQILCELASERKVATKVAPPEEAAVSKEFIQWYQRLLGAGRTQALTTVNKRVISLTEVLPTAGKTLASALAAAEPALC